MRILITNDDGIHADGLKTLERIARALSDDVWVIAPETDQSGASHSLTLSLPLRVRPVAERTYAVRGTPTDCVIMGVRHILDRAPDLVLSGVNRGQNLGDDVTYSGTVAGAMEGTLLGIRSIAFSQCFSKETRDAPHYATGECLGPDLVRRLLAIETPPGTLFNVNFPDRLTSDVRGVKVTRQGRRNPDLVEIEPREDGRGIPYYWIAFRRAPYEFEPETDLKACAEGFVSVTPLRLDLTADGFLDRLSGALA